MKKILKISLFISVFCLLMILFSNSRVQAVGETITTVQELQETMGATEYSTIEETTLKLTDNFTWNLTDDIDIKIPELTIDFNGKELKINNIAIFSTIRVEGKVIFKDSKGEKGGIYCNSIIAINEGSELIIESGQYTAAREKVNVGTR